MLIDSREKYGSPPISGPPHKSPEISRSLSLRIPIQTDKDGRPLDTQQPSQHTLLLKNVAPPWENGFQNWAQILGRSPDGRPFFREDRELIFANPSVRFPLPQNLVHVLKYLKATLASTSIA